MVKEFGLKWAAVRSFAAEGLQGLSPGPKGSGPRPQAMLEPPKEDSRLERARVRLVGPYNSPLVSCMDWLRDRVAGVSLSRLQDACAMPESAAQQQLILILDLDAFGDLEEAIDWLLDLRSHRPEVVVLAASADFRSDDFSRERLAIADASLKLPASRSRLMSGLISALNNHRHCRASC